MHGKITFGILCIILFSLLAACSNAQQANASRTEIAATIFAESQPTQKPTQPPSPIAIPSPTSAPTFSPVSAGFSVPQPQASISADNVSQVVGLALWGSGAINQIGISNEGNTIAVASELGLDVYGDGGLTPLYHWAAGQAVSGVAVSDRVDRIAYALSDQIVVASIETGVSITELPLWEGSGRTQFLFSPAGDYLAYWEAPNPYGGSENYRFCVFETGTWTEVNCFTVDDWSLSTIGFSATARYVTAAASDGVYIWDLISGELVNKYPDWYLEDLSGLFSSDDRLFLNHQLGIQLTDLTNGLPVSSFDQPYFVTTGAFSPDGTFLLLGGLASDWETGMIVLWDLENQTSSNQELPGQPTALIFSADGRYAASATDDGSIQLWELDGSRLRRSFSFEQSGTERLAFAANNKLLISVSADQVIKIWDVQNGELQQSIGERVFSGAFNAVAFSPDREYVAAGSVSGEIVVLQAENGEPVSTFTHNESESYYGAMQLGFTHDGRYLISLDNEIIRQWSLERSQMTLQFPLTSEDWDYLEPRYTGAKLIDTNDELWIVMAKTSQEILWYCHPSDAWQVNDVLVLKRASDFTEPKNLACLTTDVQNVLMVPDGSTLYTLRSQDEVVCARDEYVILNNTCYLTEQTPESYVDQPPSLVSWSSTDGSFNKEVQLTSYAWPVWSISPDGTLLAMVSVEGIDILDLATGELIQQITSPNAQSEVFYPLSPLFSPDSTLLLTGIGSEIYIWEIGSGQLLGELSGHAGTVTGLAISSDGTLLISISEDGTIRLWGIPPSEE